MILINKNNIISVSSTKIYNSCIKNINIQDITIHDNKIILLLAWLPNISSIDVSTNEMIIGFINERDNINLGFTGYEWIFDEYINNFR